MEQGGAQRVPWNDGIQEAVLQQIFGALEALGELFADGLLNHPRAGEASMMSPRLAKLAVTPPVVGWVSTEM